MITDADLSVNLDGTTVLIERTYDPLDRDGSGDFGYGWILTGLETNLQTNLPANSQQDLGVYNPFGEGTALYLTLPTGQRVKFTFAPTSFQVAGQTFYRPGLAGGIGRRATRSSRPTTVLTSADGDYYDLATGQPYNPADPFYSGPSYTLTGPDGTKYQLDAQGDAVGEITTSGVQLYISDSGITSSAATRSSSSATCRAGSRASSPRVARSSPTSTTPTATSSRCRTRRPAARKSTATTRPTRTC